MLDDLEQRPTCCVQCPCTVAAVVVVVVAAADGCGDGDDVALTTSDQHRASRRSKP